jgi:hypothetical protein
MTGNEYPDQIPAPGGELAVPEHRGRSRPWLLIALIGAPVALAGLSFIAVILFLIYIGTATPGTAVISGSRLAAKHLRQIEKLGLIVPGEKILYFYSDGMLDIEEGMYFLTDRRLVLYSNQWDPPARRIPFEEIREASIQYEDSWLEDSIVTLEVEGDDILEFPLSSEGGGDRRFYSELERRRKAAMGTAEEAAEKR